MPHRSPILALALCALFAVPATAAGHVGKHASVVWILEESCVPGDSSHADDPDWAGGDELRDLPVARARLAGRFRASAPRVVTLLMRSEGATEKRPLRVRETGRFVANLEAMPDRIALRWRGGDGTLHRTRWSGPLHSGCNDPGPPRPPGVPADWVPSYPAECGDAGAACPPPTWVPPPRPRGA
jgi:hypothetical protein